jgi:DNA-binding NarL/FixJ family response regulator
MSKIKISVFDIQPVIREGFKSIINQNKNFEFIEEYEDYQSMILGLKKTLPDIIIMDIEIEKKNGIEALKYLNVQYSNLKVIVFTLIDKEDVIFNALKCGVKGYITKNSTLQELNDGIQSVYSNNEFFSEPISNIILKSFIKQIKYGEEISEKKPRDLTKREIQILRLVCDGLTNQQIADGLFISIRTVEAHKNNIMQKLKIKTTADLIKFAIKNKYVEL